MQNSNNPPMSTEQLSQLMDGEWHDLNPSDCVRNVCGDEALRGKWARYHLIRDVIKNESIATDQTMVSRICDAIADEPAYSNITALDRNADLSEVQKTVVQLPLATTPTVMPAAQERQFSWLGTGMAGFALAASVATVTVVGMNIWQGQKGVQGPVVAQGQTALQVQTVADNSAVSIDGGDAFSQQVEGVPLPQVELVANTGSYWTSPQSSQRAIDEERLNLFLSKHLENSPTSSREGLLPYSRLVGYDERAQER